MDRPSSSAGGSRPFTAGGGIGFRPSSAARPGTAAGAGGQRPYTGHDPQYTYSLDEEDEEDEESEPEDVFAYLPPTTADPDPGPSPHHDAFAFAPAFAPAPAHPLADLPSPTTAAPFLVSPPLSMPPPTASTVADMYYTRPAYPPAETPPSTNSHSHASVDESYHMRRLEDAVAPPRTSSSREVRVSLPPPSRDEKAQRTDRHMELDLESQEITMLPKHREALSSPGGSAGDRAMSPSIMNGSEGSIKMGFDFDAVDEEDSPYPEVRASVSNIDDPDMPTMTFRMWLVGLGCCIVGTAANVFFNFRSPSPDILPMVMLLLSHPLGKLFAFCLPITVYRLPARLPLVGGVTFSLNPGPWNIKEHVLVFMMANVSLNTPYAMNAIVVGEFNYGYKTDYWFGLILVLATQLTGFGIAGLCRRFLVWPASMIWPQNLVVCTLLNTLHAEDDEGTSGMSRYRFFMYVSVAAFFWTFMPDYLFMALSNFSFICWMAPKSVPINQLFGTASGLGMSFLTFDWNQISWIGSPLIIPWWAQLHVFSSFVTFYWIAVPILYYTNTWQFARFPIISSYPFDKFGEVYNVSRVVTDNKFDEAAFDAYSPLYLAASYAMTYMLAFALSTAVIVHAVLHHGRSLLNGMKRIRLEKDDIHAKLMRSYPEVPDWWYFLSFVVFFGFAVIACEVWHTGVPVWALLLAIAVPCIYILPAGFIFAMTSQGITVNLLAQVIPGALLPGKPIANMIFKAYAIQTLNEAQSFTTDLKLGHYVKVPPRSTFLVQMVATILAAFVQVGVKEWMFAHIPNICLNDAPARLTCPHNRVYFTSSAVFGLIGPSRQFGVGALYHPEVYALIVGAVLPIPFWLWQRRRPGSVLRYVNVPVFLNGVMYLPPATGINYSSWFAVGFVFQYLLRRRNFAWWSKFNYITSAALDSGAALSVIVIFLVLQLPKNGTLQVTWWGNTVYTKTVDWNSVAYRPITVNDPIS